MRKPDLTLTRDDGSVYLKRWWIIRRSHCKWLQFNIFLHQFLGSDEDRALHDHPWPFISWIVKGEYYEETPGPDWDGFRGTQKKLRKRWSLAYRPADWTHRVELLRDLDPNRGMVYDPNEGMVREWKVIEKPVWTVILTGPKARPWGFHCRGGWIHWKTFDKQGGCE
jgi:hypothetical protein